MAPNPSPVHAVEGAGRQELLFFVSAAAGQEFGLSPTEHAEREDFLPTADFLYTYNNNRLRLLGEYLWTRDEHELERFQLGWQIGDQAMLWVGRFHQPATVWNTEYHHGQYMQTSISRPGFEQWEDDGGILPAHSTGVLLESSYGLVHGSELEYALSAGTGEVFNGSSLDPFDLLDPRGHYRPAYAFRVAYLPHALGPNKFGVLGDRNTIVVDDGGSSGLDDDIVLRRIGLYLDWAQGHWRVLPTWYDAQARLHDPDAKTVRFRALYLQVEYGLHPQWTVFARGEHISNTDNDYLRLFPDVVSRSAVLGLRHDFARRHAVTLELRRSRQTSADFGEVRLQWSAVFP
jgi:hypothetical protein